MNKEIEQGDGSTKITIGEVDEGKGKSEVWVQREEVHKMNNYALQETPLSTLWDASLHFEFVHIMEADEIS